MATTRRKTVAAKTTRKKPAAKSRKRKSTAEPKRIINRKKQTARKGSANKRAANQAAREKAAKQQLAKDARDTQRAEKLKARDKSVKEIAEALKTTPARVRKLLRNASVNPKEKMVGTDAEVARQIKKARDAGDSWPSIRVRTGMSGAKIRKLYAEAGGTGPKAKKTTAKKATTAKRGAAKKAAASKAKPKAAARSKRTAKSKAAAKEDAAPTGRPKGRRARRAGLMKFLDEVVHDLDSDNDEVAEGLTNHTIEVTRDFNGRKVRPTEHKVVKVKSVVLHDTEGRVIEFVDENYQDRFVSSREITALK